MPAERRSLRFDDWDDVLAEVEALRAGGYETAGWGTLTLGQACVHLASVLETAVDGTSEGLPGPLRWILKKLFLKSMLAHKPSNVRAKTAKSFEPPQQISDEEGIERMRQVIDKFENHQGDYEPHLLFGKLSREEWKHQQLWHFEHHLGLLVPKAG